jgi:hypothetical protein
LWKPITINDIIDPTAECIQCIHSLSLLLREVAEGSVEGAGGCPGDRFAMQVSILEAFGEGGLSVFNQQET